MSDGWILTKIGDRSTCTACDRPIMFNGAAWDHDGEVKPRHIASPRPPTRPATVASISGASLFAEPSTEARVVTVLGQHDAVTLAAAPTAAPPSWFRVVTPTHGYVQRWRIAIEVQP